MTELDKLNQLELQPYSNTTSCAKQEAIYAESIPLNLANTATVASPDPAQMADPTLMIRFELMYAWKTAGGAEKTAFLAPGQSVPMFRRKGNKWEQILRHVELRAYGVPFFKGRAWLTGQTKPRYNELEEFAHQPTGPDTQVATPGGLLRLSSYPEIPGLLPMKTAVSIGGRQLSRAPFQLGDFIKLFGDHPLVPLDAEQQYPFRFVGADLTQSDPETEDGTSSLLDGTLELDQSTTNPITGEWIGGLKSLDLPVSFCYAEEFFTEFSARKYDEGVRDHLKDEDWVFLQHTMAPYMATEVEECIHNLDHSAPITREELPHAAFLAPWSFTPKKKEAENNKIPDYWSLNPYAYDKARKLKDGSYNPVGA